MPLLMCPNDNAAMQTVNRSEVQFDICPTCRGVWLDRGELEKLMGAAQDGGGAEHRRREVEELVGVLDFTFGEPGMIRAEQVLKVVEFVAELWIVVAPAGEAGEAGGVT